MPGGNLALSGNSRVRLVRRRYLPKADRWEVYDALPAAIRAVLRRGRSGISRRCARVAMSSVTSSAAAAVTTNMFLPPVDAVTSSIMLASRLALCKPLDQSIQSPHCTVMARGVTDPFSPVLSTSTCRGCAPVSGCGRGTTSGFCHASRRLRRSARRELF